MVPCAQVTDLSILNKMLCKYLIKHVHRFADRACIHCSLQTASLRCWWSKSQPAMTCSSMDVPQHEQNMSRVAATCVLQRRPSIAYVPPMSASAAWRSGSSAPYKEAWTARDGLICLAGSLLPSLVKPAQADTICSHMHSSATSESKQEAHQLL